MDDQLIEVPVSGNESSGEGLSCIGWDLDPNFMGLRVRPDINSDLEQWSWRRIRG